MIEFIILAPIFMVIAMFLGIPMLTNYNFSYIGLRNIIFSLILLGIEIFTYFYPNNFLLFFSKPYQKYREIFSKTANSFSKKIQKISILMAGMFVLVNLILAYQHLAIEPLYSTMIFIIIALSYQFLLLVYSSSEEKQKYLNFLKENYTTFSKSGLTGILAIVIIGSIFLYFIEYGGSGTFCYVDAKNHQTVLKNSFEKITSVRIRGDSMTEQQIISVLNKCDSEKLKTLNISNCKISDKFWETAKRFHKLTNFSLWDVEISRLPEFFSEVFPNIKLLFIFNCENLKEVPDAIGNLEKAKWLTLYKCGLRKLPKNIKNLKNLKKLDISYNPLESIEEICLLQNLEALDIRHCSLKSLPENITNLKKLKTLYIGHNDFIEFPKQIRKLKNLALLDASNLRLKSIPPEIFELKNLSNLTLFRNQLESLPDEILNLKDLQYLFLGYNKFKTIPSQILKMPYLKEVSFSNNQLSELPPEMEDLVTRLTRFDISHNEFKTFPVILKKFNKKGVLINRNNPYNKKD